MSAQQDVILYHMREFVTHLCRGSVTREMGGGSVDVTYISYAGVPG